MPRVAHRAFVIEKGIEKILRGPGEAGPAGLGAGTDIAPASSPARSRLEQLYAQPNLEDYLAEELAWEVNEAALLQPGRFNAALAWLLEDLRAKAAKDPRNARILGKAARQLASQVSLGLQLREYRDALFKG